MSRSLHGVVSIPRLLGVFLLRSVLSHTTGHLMSLTLMIGVYKLSTWWAT